MPDRTAWYMLGMVAIVALTAVILMLIAAGHGSNAAGSAGATGFVALDSSSDAVVAPPGTTQPIASLAQSPASGVKRTLTILSVSFLLGIAAFLYFHPDYA